MKQLFTITLLLFTTQLFAQELEIPNNVKLESSTDYKNAEELVLKSINWLKETPIDEQQVKRKEVNTFLMKWLTGSPTVSIELRSELIPNDCADCLMIFMAGWAEYSLTNEYSKDKIAGALAGVESVIAFYEKNKEALGRNSAIEKMSKRKKKGKLQKYVEGIFED